MTLPQIITLADVEALYGEEGEITMETRLRYSDARGVQRDEAVSEVIWQQNMERIEAFCARHMAAHPGCTYAEALEACWWGNPEYLRIYTRMERG